MVFAPPLFRGSAFKNLNRTVKMFTYRLASDSTYRESVIRNSEIVVG